MTGMLIVIKRVKHSQTVTIDLGSQNREKSDSGTRVCLRALVEGSNYISCSRKGGVGWCYWSELEPRCEGSMPGRWRCHSPCSQAACETHSESPVRREAALVESYAYS